MGGHDAVHHRSELTKGVFNWHLLLTFSLAPSPPWAAALSALADCSAWTTGFNLLVRNTTWSLWTILTCSGADQHYFGVMVFTNGACSRLHATNIQFYPSTPSPLSTLTKQATFCWITICQCHFGSPTTAPSTITPAYYLLAHSSVHLPLSLWVYGTVNLQLTNQTLFLHLPHHTHHSLHLPALTETWITLRTRPHLQHYRQTMPLRTLAGLLAEEAGPIV